jgi:3'-phosphoadenosine 5'-phosphosulfate sulfotransferase (PAPS reductase)/FAD synthetase
MHVIQMSGGIGSFWAAKRVIAAHGKRDVVLLFADTLVEDPDLYRFLRQAREHLGVELVVVADGRTPWEVFFDEHFVGNSRLAPCSKRLKQIPCRKWLEAHCDPATTTVYVGIDADEPQRLPGVVNGWDGWKVEFPMTAEPRWTKKQMLDECEELGIRVPLLYKVGYSHNNCGGTCVRAGQRTWLLTLQAFPERYAEAEREEERFRQEFGKDVSILRETVKGERRTLTLAELRRRYENGTVRVPVPKPAFIPAAA